MARPGRHPPEKEADVGTQSDEYDDGESDYEGLPCNEKNYRRKESNQTERSGLVGGLPEPQRSGFGVELGKPLAEDAEQLSNSVEIKVSRHPRSVEREAGDTEDAQSAHGDEIVEDDEAAGSTVVPPDAPTGTRAPRRRRPKLEAGFFCPSLTAYQRVTDPDAVDAEGGDDEAKDATDKLWDFFVDVVADFPTLREQMEADGEIDIDRAAMRHLDRLLVKIRSWSQTVYPYGLSLAEFGKSVEKASVKPEFQEYRTQLIRRYKTTDWRLEAAERRRTREAAESVARPGQGAGEPTEWTNSSDGGAAATATPRENPGAALGDDPYGPDIDDYYMDASWGQATGARRSSDTSPRAEVQVTADLRAKIAAKRSELLAQRKLQAQRDTKQSGTTAVSEWQQEKIHAKRRMLLALRKSRLSAATKRSEQPDAGM